MTDCRIICCVNQKGGVGKSVTSTNLAAGLVYREQRVLVVDCDSQASQTISLGWKTPDELPVTLATQLLKVIENKAFAPREGILSHKEKIDLVPSSIELSGLEMRLINVMSREYTLKTYLEPLKQDYDVIVLDCPPTLGMITINALAAADSVIIPVQPEYLSVIGMTQLFETIGLVKKQINPQLKVEGVLFTLANMRTTLARNTIDLIQKAYGDNIRIFPEPIPYSVKVKEASSVGQSIFTYDRHGKAAYAYAQLVKGVIERDNRDGGFKSGTNIRVTEKDEPDR
jgi:chromosome partitioning protein